MTEALDLAPEPTPAPEPKKPSRPRRSGTRRPRTPKVNVRQVAQKAQQIAEASPEERDVLAELIGAPGGDVVDLTVTIMEAKKDPVRDAIEDLRTIQESEVPVATIHLVGMDKDAHEQLVRLLSAVASAEGLPDRIPARSTDAALALIEPVRTAEVDQESLDRLLRLLER